MIYTKIENDGALAWKAAIGTAALVGCLLALFYIRMPGPGQRLDLGFPTPPPLYVLYNGRMAIDPWAFRPMATGVTVCREWQFERKQCVVVRSDSDAIELALYSGLSNIIKFEHYYVYRLMWPINLPTRKTGMTITDFYSAALPWPPLVFIFPVEPVAPPV